MGSRGVARTVRMPCPVCRREHSAYKRCTKWTRLPGKWTMWAHNDPSTGLLCEGVNTDVSDLVAVTDSVAALRKMDEEANGG